MSVKRILQVPITSSFASATAGSKLFFPLQLGYRYHRIDIIYIDGGGSPTVVTTALADIELQINQRGFRLHAASELDHINGTNGTAYLAANLTTNGAAANERQCLPILFNESPWRKDQRQADSLAVNADPSWGVNAFSLFITVGASNIPSTASILILAYVDNVLANPKNMPQYLKHVKRFDLPASGTAQDFNTVFPVGVGYQALYFISPTGGYLSYLTVKADGVTIRDRVSNFDNVAAMEAAGLVPGSSTSAAGYGYDMVLDWDDPIQNCLVPVRELLLHAEYSASASGKLRTLADIYAPLGSIN